jgi:hypothetical protein
MGATWVVSACIGSAEREVPVTPLFQVASAAGL